MNLVCKKNGFELWCYRSNGWAVLSYRKGEKHCNENGKFKDVIEKWFELTNEQA